MKRLLIVALGLALGLGTLAGCGNSKSDEPATVKDLRSRGKPADKK